VGWRYQVVLILLYKKNNMKKIIILFGIIATVCLAVSSCKKFEDKSLERGVGIVPLISNLTPESPLFVDVMNDSVKFSVSLAAGETAEKVAIKVTYKGKSAILKEITPPADVKIVGSDILTALNIPKDSIVLGTSFQIDVATTVKGATTVSPAAFLIQLPCNFDASLASGNYQMFSADWNVDASVKLKADNTNPNIVYIDGLAEADFLISNGNLMKLVIDPVSFKVTGDATIIAADCAPWGSPYDTYLNYSYQVVSGMYSSCDGSYKILFDIFADAGDFGTYTFTFTRK
jgi:hypothetical protein